MILSGETIRQLNIIKPFSERTTIYRSLNSVLDITISHGVGPNGYDVRVEFDRLGKQKELLLWPGRFALASTIEHITMPNNVMACIHDKSTWIRLGLEVHNSTIDAGWSGYLTLELHNKSPNPITLLRGDPIANLIFHEIKGLIVPYDGKYQNQERGPQEAI